jgi:hypothetical protein
MPHLPTRDGTLATPLHLTRRRWLALAGGMGVALVTPGCEFSELFAWNGGHFTFFGYSTRANYDMRFKTIQVKIFKNPTFWAVVPVPGLEMQVTENLVKQIESKTPYKVVQCNADTEMTGSIRAIIKSVINYNQMNEQRDVEVTMVVEVLWRNLRTGEILSAPPKREFEPLPPNGLAPDAVDPLQSNPVPGLVQPVIPNSPNSPLVNPNPATMAGTSPETSATGGAPQPPISPSQPGIPPLPGTPGAPPKQPMGTLVRAVAYYKPELGQSITTALQDCMNNMSIQIISMMEKPW